MQTNFTSNLSGAGKRIYRKQFPSINENPLSFVRRIHTYTGVRIISPQTRASFTSKSVAFPEPNPHHNPAPIRFARPTVATIRRTLGYIRYFAFSIARRKKPESFAGLFRARYYVFRTHTRCFFGELENFGPIVKRIRNLPRIYRYEVIHRSVCVYGFFE